MMRKKSIIAEEFLHQLEQDKKVSKKIMEKEKKINKLKLEYARDERKLVKELRSVGLYVNSVWDLVNKHGKYEKAYPILVKHLDIKHNPKIREGIIRALTVNESRAIAEGALLRHFSKERNKNLKWVLANSLTIVIPYYKRKRHPEINKVYRNL